MNREVAAVGRSLAPGFAYPAWRALERALPALERATAMFALVVVEANWS